MGEEHRFVLEGTAGVRIWYVDTSTTVRDDRGTVLLSGGGNYDLVDPVIGVRGSQYLARKFHVDFSGDFGGFNLNHNTDITWSVAGLMTYDFTKWFSLSAGYKALGIDEQKNTGVNQNGLNLIFNGVVVAARFQF